MKQWRYEASTRSLSVLVPQIVVQKEKPHLTRSKRVNHVYKLTWGLVDKYPYCFFIMIQLKGISPKQTQISTRH